MYCNIIIDKKNEEKLRSINQYYEGDKYEVTEHIFLKYVENYIYFYKLLHYTPLPKDVINIICDQLCERIKLTIRVYSSYRFLYKDIRINISAAEQVYQKTEDVKEEYEWYADCWYYGYLKDPLCARINNNILQRSVINDRLSRKNGVLNYVYKIIKQIIHNPINYNNSFHIGDTIFTVVNHNKMLIICNIIGMVSKYIKNIDVRIRKDILKS